MGFKPKPTVNREATEKELKCIEDTEEMLGKEQKLPPASPQIRDLATTHWRDFNSSTRFNNDSETFKFKLFYEEFDLKPIPPHGMVKQRIDLPKNGHPIRIEIGCRKWVYGRY